MESVYIKINNSQFTSIIATKTETSTNPDTGEEISVEKDVTVADFFQFPINAGNGSCFIHLWPVRANHCIYPKDEPTQAQINEWMALLGVTETYTRAEALAAVPSEDI